MPRRPSAFTQTDVARAVKGAREAGLVVGTVEVTPDGTIRVTVGADHREPANDLPFDSWKATKNASAT
jgi:hypothetical protein